MASSSVPNNRFIFRRYLFIYLNDDSRGNISDSDRWRCDVIPNGRGSRSPVSSLWKFWKFVLIGGEIRGGGGGGGIITDLPTRYDDEMGKKKIYNRLIHFADHICVIFIS